MAINIGRSGQDCLNYRIGYVFNPMGDLLLKMYAGTILINCEVI